MTGYVPLRTALGCVVLGALCIVQARLTEGTVTLSLLLFALPYLLPSRPLIAPIDGLVMGVLVLTLPLSQVPVFFVCAGVTQLLIIAGLGMNPAPLMPAIWLGYLAVYAWGLKVS